MNNAVFASSRSHALAMIRWLKLDPSIWHANVYGGNMRDTYDRAILVRPVEGVFQEHFIWITLVLVPRMEGIDHITVMHWYYDEFPMTTTVEDQLLYTENYLSTGQS